MSLVWQIIKSQTHFFKKDCLTRCKKMAQLKNRRSKKYQTKNAFNAKNLIILQHCFQDEIYSKTVQIISILTKNVFELRFYSLITIASILLNIKTAISISILIDVLKTIHNKKHSIHIFLFETMKPILNFYSILILVYKLSYLTFHLILLYPISNQLRIFQVNIYSLSNPSNSFSTIVNSPSIYILFSQT